LNVGKGYHSYLLRLWQADNGEAPEWRIVLEDVRSRERQSFASVDHLTAFLRVQMQTAQQGGGSAVENQLGAADSQAGD
jgi:hypothetical protein